MAKGRLEGQGVGIQMKGEAMTNVPDRDGQDQKYRLVLLQLFSGWIATEKSLS